MRLQRLAVLRLLIFGLGRLLGLFGLLRLFFFLFLLRMFFIFRFLFFFGFIFGLFRLFRLFRLSGLVVRIGLSGSKWILLLRERVWRIHRNVNNSLDGLLGIQGLFCFRILRIILLFFRISGLLTLRSSWVIVSSLLWLIVLRSSVIRLQ